MKIELREPREPATPEQIAAAEARVAERGLRVPPSYKAFLAQQDGGGPVRNYFTFDRAGQAQSDYVKLFLGVTPAPDGDIVFWADDPERMGGMLPIAIDSLGNAIVIDSTGDRDGPVYFWDHEADAEEEPGAQLSWLASDLETFVDGLIEDPEPDEPPPPKPTGWRRLFGS